MFKKLQLVPKLRTSVYTEIMLLVSVITVVILRYFLVLNYSGNSTIFVAAMLGGVLAMIAAILLVLTFFGRRIELISTVLAGIGFGVFIDQLEKFITFNNDRFFQSAIPIIYFVFIFIFLLGRHFLSSRELSAKDYLVNSLQIIQDGFITSNKNRKFYEHIEYLLKKAGRKNPNVKYLHQLVQAQISPLPDISEDHLSISKRIKLWYQRSSDKRIVEYVAILFFVLFNAFNAYNIIQPLFDGWSFVFTDLSVLEQLEFLSAIIITIITLGGLLEFIFSRRHAYKTLELSVYLSLFLLQIFVFYNNDQLLGSIGLIASVIALFGLKYLIKLEEQHMHEHVLGRIKSTGKLKKINRNKL